MDNSHPIIFQLVQLWGTRELDEDEEKVCHLIPVGGEVCSSIYAEDTPDQMTHKGTSKNPWLLPTKPRDQAATQLKSRHAAPTKWERDRQAATRERWRRYGETPSKCLQPEESFSRLSERVPWGPARQSVSFIGSVMNLLVEIR